jgi:hypothetical protein
LFTFDFFGFIGAYLRMWLANQFGRPEIFAINIDGPAISHYLVYPRRGAGRGRLRVT